MSDMARAIAKGHYGNKSRRFRAGEGVTSAGAVLNSLYSTTCRSCQALGQEQAGLLRDHFPSSHQLPPTIPRGGR